jgi:hypothetical protein
VLSVAVNGVFLVEVAAPRLLHLPYHHCPYDLVPGAPESLVGVALGDRVCVAATWADTRNNGRPDLYDTSAAATSFSATTATAPSPTCP